MTFGFALLTAGTVLMMSGYANRSIAEVLQGFVTPRGTGPGEGAFVTGAKEVVEGVKEAATGEGTGGGGGVAAGPTLGGSKNVLEHPELKPGIASITATVLTRFPGLSIGSTTSGSHAEDSYHYSGRAVDLVGSQKEMDRAARWIARYLTPTLTEGIHNPGLSVDGGHKVPASFWGSSTWAGHTNHIHLAK